MPSEPKPGIEAMLALGWALVRTSRASAPLAAAGTELGPDARWHEFVAVRPR